ncbi:serine hydrolase [Bradyrhizobium sp. INPA01-394B]|uniref:Serine hydrolase n=2 Tax=Bradyrhizobium campsiandrae TaxID=1729892 RepID=A0ABR7U3G5_9BRAD|nr:serine hydrolase [Bradyrhizobium campsiandrae]MBC9978579.1 serine hydrolase [Bradyrhizobium campsiandrae]
MSSAFETSYGFPRSDVRLSNWRDAPWNVWAFRHVSELIPTAPIAATAGLAEHALVSAEGLIRETASIDGANATIADILSMTSADAMVVMKSGRIIADFHAPRFDLETRHILFSASKSVTAIVAGILEGDGALDVDKVVAHYVPELKSSAYADARIRDLLDMRLSLDFEETYLDPRGDFARYRRAGLFEPPAAGDTPETLLAFLSSLKKGPKEHCGPFRYASPNSDVLGLVIERASGLRFADLVSIRLWQPLGARRDAYVTVDAAGSARTGGGICMTPRDLARIGEMMRLGGVVNGRRIVSQEWIADLINNGSAEAWAQGKSTEWLPNGRYRSKWYQTGEASKAFFALGIHGQWLYVDPAAEMVIAKFSSQPVPVSNDMKRLNLALFDRLAKLI